MNKMRYFEFQVQLAYGYEVNALLELMRGQRTRFNYVITSASEKRLLNMVSHVKPEERDLFEKMLMGRAYEST